MAKRFPKKQSWMKDFVRFELSAAQRQQMREWYSANSDVWAELGSLLLEGYSFKFTAERDTGTCVCRVGIDDTNHHNAGLLLSGRGSRPEKAAAECLFKHGLLQGDWRVAAPIDDDEDW